jgi:hypothetical protein
VSRKKSKRQIHSLAYVSETFQKNGNQTSKGRSISLITSKPPLFCSLAKWVQSKHSKAVYIGGVEIKDARGETANVWFLFHHFQKRVKSPSHLFFKDMTDKE